eukprot:CAMPEP_0117577290 /NCGR_PEP_ID=MMETSP0784-20121206/63332_1 /TAXON_ID=39447 /ORGANISM="" /LENGTH=76 /DNA_ID=CAMNT_0005376759 /DNA_START=1 /DNA_END=229 /DNA_ORIENTATION=+
MVAFQRLIAIALPLFLVCIPSDAVMPPPTSSRAAVVLQASQRCCQGGSHGEAVIDDFVLELLRTPSPAHCGVAMVG